MSSLPNADDEAQLQTEEVMDDDATQPSTQPVLDPRRLGRTNSGLDDADIADVFCILTPTSPAAYRIVAATAKRSPQHILQSHSNAQLTNHFSQSLEEEAETFILDNPGHANDLALRFSSRTNQTFLQFCFGRNVQLCDIVFQLGPDPSKRVSNSHFRIYINEWGILLLEDMSTNGTMVDHVLLKAKSRDPNAAKTQMLNNGSMISILSPKADEIIKFIVRIPSRDGHQEEWEARLHAYLDRVEIARQQQLAIAKQRAKNGQSPTPGFVLPVVPMRAPRSTVRRPALSTHTFGMHWNGRPDYNVVDQLGKGAFATVYKLATAMDGQLLAAKELEKKRFIKNGQMDQKLDNEMKIMKGLSHPNIVKYIDCRDEGSYLYIIMEYVPFGNLSEWLNRNELLPESIAKRMACQIFSSLAYLHSRKITHRDIKPDNILIASEDPFDVKLSDFGLSKAVGNNDTFLKTFCGTLLYCAPEVFPHYNGQSNKKRRKPGEAKKTFHSYSQSVDIWSFGAVLWYALCGQPPFEGVMDNNGRGMFNKIMETRLDPSPLHECGISAAAIDLLMAMLNTDPAMRLTEQQCLSHPWLAELAGEIVPDIIKPDLNAIPEEDEEAEAEAEDKFSQLSIRDKAGYGPPDSSEEDEDHEEDAFEPDEMIPPRQSKRIKRDQLFSRYQARDIAESESSPETSQYFVPGVHDGLDRVHPRPPRSKPRLFGEIGLSALESSGVLERQTHQAVSVDDDDSSNSFETGSNLSPRANQSIKRRSKTPGESQTTPREDPRGNTAAPSLLGTESRMRGLTVDSPSPPNSPSETTNEPRTPRTPDVQQDHSFPETPKPQFPRIGHDNCADAPSHCTDEATPKAPRQNFSRQINLPTTPSLYWDPNDPSTHTIEYASRVSGYNFGAKEPISGFSSMSSTHFPSDASEDGADDEANGYGNSLIAEPRSSPLPIDPEFRPLPPRLGKLTSTKDSIISLVIKLEKHVEAWGRDSGCTIRYEDLKDARIPRLAFTIWHYAPGIEKMMEEKKDWTKMENLQVLIETKSRLGIRVNGMRLNPPMEDGRWQFGQIHTGDVITVFEAGKHTLKFVCEFFHGESAHPRPEGSVFHIRMTHPSP